MPHLPSKTPKQLARILENHGFVLDHVTGSHYIYFNNQTRRITTVPMHNRTLSKGTLSAILKQAGIDRDSL